MDIPKLVLDFLKLAPRYLFAVGVFSAVLLFSSEAFLRKIGLFDFVNSWRSILGAVLLASVILFLIFLAATFFNAIKKWRRKMAFEKRIIRRLRALTEEEKQILRYYIGKQSKANTLRIDDGVVKGFVAEGVIYQSASMGNILEGFAHNISELAWNYLQLYPELLNGNTNTYRTDKREYGRW